MSSQTRTRRPSDLATRPYARGLEPTQEGGETAESPRTARKTGTVQEFSRRLADRFVSPSRLVFVRWFAVSISLLGVVLAFTLIYLRLDWFFFGPSMTVAALATLLVVGDDIGRSPIRTRFLSWIRIWPAWEKLAGGVALITFGITAVLFQLWPPIVMGAVVGFALAAIYQLAIVLPVKEKREPVADYFDRIVRRLQSSGVRDLDIESGMPKLMGPNWMPLFERQFGYEIYRSVANQISSVEPSLLQRRNRLRDFVCDFLGRNAQFQRGLLGGLADLRGSYLAAVEGSRILEQMESAEAESLGEDGVVVIESMEVETATTTERVDAGKDASKVHLTQLRADRFDINSLQATNLTLQVSEEQLQTLAMDTGSPVAKVKKRQFDEMMEAARTTQSMSADRIRRMKALHRWLGDEARLTIGLILMLLFGTWVYTSGLLSGESLDRITRAIVGFQFGSLSAFGSSMNSLGQALRWCPQGLFASGPAGWGLLSASVLLIVSSVKGGWRLSMYVLPASIALVVAFTMTLCFEASSAWTWSAILMAIFLVATGILRERSVGKT